MFNSSYQQPQHPPALPKPTSNTLPPHHNTLPHPPKAVEAQTGQFLSACGKGEIDRVKLMLGQGFDPNAVDYGNRTGLMLAAGNGQKVGVVWGLAWGL